MVEGEIRDDSLLVFIYELDKEDELFDESVWIKANPNLGVSVDLDYLRAQVNEAKHKPTAKNKFERYHANRTVTAIDTPIDLVRWDEVAIGELTPWSDAAKVGIGVDLGGHDDLASYAIATAFEVDRKDIQLPDGTIVEDIQYRYEVASKSFISEDTPRDLTQEPWASWIREGKLAVSDQVHRALRESLVIEAQRVGCQWVCYDPYQAAALAEMLKMEGMSPVKMPQNHANFSETIDTMLSALAEGRFQPLASDAVLRWAASNVALRMNPQGQAMCDKAKSKEKIDPIVAMLMAMRALTYDQGRVDPLSLFVS